MSLPIDFDIDAAVTPTAVTAWRNVLNANIEVSATAVNEIGLPVFLISVFAVAIDTVATFSTNFVNVAVLATVERICTARPIAKDIVPDIEERTSLAVVLAFATNPIASTVISLMDDLAVAIMVDASTIRYCDTDFVKIAAVNRVASTDTGNIVEPLEKAIIRRGRGRGRRRKNVAIYSFIPLQSKR